MASKDDRAEAAKHFFRDVAQVGPVRLVLRNCAGFAELFCSTERLRVMPGWLNLHLPSAHLHVRLPACHAVRFVEGEDGGPAEPSIWFYSPCGSPFLLLILDQVVGAARMHQVAVFEALRTRYGEHVRLGDADALIPETFH
jgi:putative heme iron utilization protein